MCVGNSYAGYYGSYEYDIRNIRKSEFYPNGETKYYLSGYSFGKIPHITTEPFRFTKKDDIYFQETPYEYTHPITNNTYYITLEAVPNYDYLHTYNPPYTSNQLYNYKGVIVESTAYKNIR